MKRSLIIIACLTVLVVLGFAGRKAKPFSNAEHATFQTALWRLKHLDAVFNQDVLEARFGLMNNYDDFGVYAAQLKENLEALNQIPGFTTPEGREAINNAKKEYTVLLTQRDDLLERFKSRNAVVANSRRYFPVAAEELANRLGNDPASRELNSLVNNLSRAMLVRVSNSEAMSEQAEDCLSKLKEWSANHPEHPEARFASTLQRHARIIFAGKGDLDNLIRQLLALRTEEALQKMSLSYESEVSKALQRAGYYRLMLSALGLFVLAGIVYTFRTLRAANRNLEKRVEERTSELTSSEERFRTLCLSAPIGIQMSDAQGLCTYTNPAWEKISSLTSELCRGAGWLSAVHPDERAQVAANWDAAIRNEKVFSREYRILQPEEKICWVSSQAVAIHTGKGTVAGFVSTLRDITARKEAETKLETAHQKLLETSHQAGMAEVATNVLHNVGNVLNSVNVSATLIADRLKASKINSVTQLADLFQQHSEDLAEYVTNDPTGKQLPSYVRRLGTHLNEQWVQLLQETESVRKNIGHIKDIVAMQQNYAKTSGVVETIKVADLIEDALRMNVGSLTRHDVELVRDYAPNVSDITVEKHKVLQVLVNLIRNAKQACDESGREDKKLTMRLTNGGSRVRISVIDNGIGIPQENMTRIFGHGFTTRKDGHGFGLHGAALAARQMGGALVVHSDGPRQGATFTLELPLEAPGNENE